MFDVNVISVDNAGIFSQINNVIFVINSSFSGPDQAKVAMLILTLTLISLILREATVMFTCKGPPSRIPSDELAR